MLAQQEARYISTDFQTDKCPITCKYYNETICIGYGTEYEGQYHVVSGWGTTSSGEKNLYISIYTYDCAYVSVHM